MVDGWRGRKVGLIEPETTTNPFSTHPSPLLTVTAKVIAGHLVVMNSWGYISSFGVFQTYYASTLGRSPSDISWIGSFQIFLLFFIGVLTGRLTDGGYFRQVMLTGIVFQGLGLFTTSAATQYWQVFLAQGVCMGLGNGCLFCPSLAVVSTYFKKRRALAIGIMASGTGTGGLVFPSIARQLLPAVGFGWTVRTIGFIQLATLAVVFFVLRPRLPPRRTGPFLELSAFKELEYTFYACASFFVSNSPPSSSPLPPGPHSLCPAISWRSLAAGSGSGTNATGKVVNTLSRVPQCFLGLYFAFFYIASFGRDVIGLSYTEGLNLLLVLNGVGIPGRVLPNIVADRVGPLTMFVPAAGLAGATMLAWTGVRSAAGLYVWVVFYGLFAGGIQSLFPAGISSLAPDMSKVGVRLGMIFTIVSFAALTGAPIAGAILAASGGRYRGAQIFAGVSMLVGCAFLVAARVAKARKVPGGWKAKI